MTPSFANTNTFANPNTKPHRPVFESTLGPGFRRVRFRASNAQALCGFTKKTSLCGPVREREREPLGSLGVSGLLNTESRAGRRALVAMHRIRELSSGRGPPRRLSFCIQSPCPGRRTRAA